MSLQFRHATIEDLPTIVEIYNSVIPGRSVTADTEMVTVDSKVNWFREHHERRPLWVVMEEGKNIGWVSFQDFYGRPAYNTTAEISIYLHETARGKGFGKEILNHIFQECPSLRIKNLLGFIFEHNTASLKLFMQFGFEQWARLPNIAVLDGIERSLIIVGKRTE